MKRLVKFLFQLSLYQLSTNISFPKIVNLIDSLFSMSIDTLDKNAATAISEFAFLIFVYKDPEFSINEIEALEEVSLHMLFKEASSIEVLYN